MDQRIILVTLLVKLGASAAISAALVRSREFHSRLYKEKRTLTENLLVTFAISVPYGLGVQVRRMVNNFKAADLAFEGTIIMGLIGGPLAGAVGGALVAAPAVYHHEYLTLPFNVLIGIFAGALRDLADREAIWSFSPFIDLTIFRWIKRNFPRPQMDWQIVLFVVIIVLDFGRMQLARLFPTELFALQSNEPWIMAAIMATTVMCVGIPMKIWNNTRIELKLEEQTRLLLQARMDALQSQINPHFLFNTLNSISSLVRVDPDAARRLIVRLGNILRSLLRKHDAFSALREEIDFMEDYLDIEVVRFGRDKLRILKDLDEETLELVVPSMMLQPLIENAVKHGLAPKVDGGSITVRSRMIGAILQIEVEDDGVGMEGSSATSGAAGIGLSNVRERLSVLYGEQASMTILLPPGGEGTLIRIELPIMQTELPESAAEKIYSERSRTRA